MNQEKPKIIVGAIIYDDNNKIFLAKSYKWKDKWVVPGGHLEWGESLENCVKREIKEETNLDVSNIELVGIQENIFPEEFHKKKHFIFLDYCCHTESDNVKLNDELQEHTWINPKAALKLELNPTTERFIKRFIKKKMH